MNCFLIIATISILFVLYLIIHRNNREVNNSGNSANEARNFDEMFLCATESCRNVICPALDLLTGVDVIEACKNQGKGSDSLCTLMHKVKRSNGSNSDKEPKFIYLSYMTDSAEKISETIWHMVIRPSFKMSISDKCEIHILRKMMEDMLRPDYDHQQIGENKAFVKHLIAVHSKSMAHEDFSDREQASSYLTLLYYLHFFINSLYRIISTSSQSPRQ